MSFAGNKTGAQVDEGIRKALQMPELKGEVANFAALPGGASVGDIYLVIAATGFWPFKDKAGWYRWSGSAWIFMGNSIAAFQASMTTSSDPATNAATSTANIDNFGGVVITTTTTANAQTLQAPTDTTSGRQFIVINDDASSDPITINGTAVTTGKMVSFIWDGSAWIGPQDVSTDVTLVGTPNYITISGQEITMALIATSDIADEAVTNAKLAHIATKTMKGRTTAATGDVQDLTAAQARAVMDVEPGVDVQAFLAGLTLANLHFSDSESTGSLVSDRVITATRPGTFTGWYMNGDDTQSGSITCDILKNGVSIVASAAPSITTALRNDSTTLTGWTLTFVTGDRFTITYSGITTFTAMDTTLTYTPT